MANTLHLKVEQCFAHDAERQILMRDLLQEAEEAKTKLEKVELDLENERAARRSLQRENAEFLAKKGLVEQRPYVVVLLDADGDDYVFDENYLKDGARGGERVADKLHAQVQAQLAPHVENLDKCDVIVKAYANVDGRGQALVKLNTVNSVVDFRSFWQGFVGRRGLFDFVDVGYGKEKADHKIRETALFHCQSWQCKRVLLGCCHDSGYAPFLAQLASDSSQASKITMLQPRGYSNAISKLAFHTTNLGGIFASYKTTESSLSNVLIYPFANTYSLEPIIQNSAGLRIDRPLNAKEAVVTRLRKADMCNWFFLVGQCKGCGRTHDAKWNLSETEFVALWFLARQGECHKSRKKLACDDVKCIYGHRP